MNNEQKIYSCIGMANKAGKLVSGEEIVRNSMRQKKVLILIISSDASDNTKKRFKNTAAYYSIPFVIWGEKYLLGKHIGKTERSVIGITDEGFSRNINKLGNGFPNRKDSEDIVTNRPMIRNIA